ncbi:phosphoglucan phosphatase DSP4, amyloplastic-like isoform X2 [Citrus sinensis]|uniref:phosphoglucan phosphatase DSP4, amyloplastic-like isoform X2 n=1 Tax=Citrus clementina TaxID=85681 RepID=UPI000CED0F29|nr:phosphoglucan phosphatase DSP4, amyloplastic-like isoform X2 [Citrus x clementina]XP_052295379.1 phosphoglucan phosphatase DSP4, amyloplastic-like isoform X2 [Citrus sinensis]
MNCLQNLPRSSALPLQSFRFNQRKPTSSSSFNSLGTMNYAHLNRRITVKAITGSTSSKETSDSSEVKEEKSEIYSTNMTEAMGAESCHTTCRFWRASFNEFKQTQGVELCPLSGHCYYRERSRRASPRQEAQGQGKTT